MKKSKTKSKKPAKQRKRVRSKFEMPEVVRVARKRQRIDIAVPIHRLWVCKLGRVKIAFIKGQTNYPIGVMERKRKRKSDYVLTVRPFDSTEHEKLAAHLCLSR